MAGERGGREGGSDDVRQGGSGREEAIRRVEGGRLIRERARKGQNEGKREGRKRAE